MLFIQIYVVDGRIQILQDSSYTQFTSGLRRDWKEGRFILLGDHRNKGCFPVALWPLTLANTHNTQTHKHTQHTNTHQHHNTTHQHTTHQHTQHTNPHSTDTNNNDTNTEYVTHSNNISLTNQKRPIAEIWLCWSEYFMSGSQLYQSQCT